VRLIAGISSRFGAVVTARRRRSRFPWPARYRVGGHYLFANHFQNLARAHFIIKRLEASTHGIGPRGYDNLTV